MKKIITIVVIVIGLGLLVFLMGRITPSNDNISIIQDAWLNQGSAVCTFVQPGDDYYPEEEISVQIKAGKIRMTTQLDSDMEGNVIIKDGIVYFWDNQMGMEMPIQQGELNDIPLFSELENVEEFAKMEQEYQIDCNVVSIQDSVFDIPEDIEFQDYSEMLMEQTQDIEDLEGVEDLDVEDLEITE